MDSYNLVNGVHATQNCRLNNDILKKDWAFNGILMSDWDATYDAVGPANCGLDLEMPSGKFMNPKNLLPAVKSGKVTEAIIDNKVRRIFRTAIRFGFLDRDQTDLSIPYYNPNGKQVALDEARESITLFKNDGNLLPLSTDKVHTIAVFGPDAWPAVPGGGGSSQVTAFSPVSIMTGLSDHLAGRVKVVYARGLASLEELFLPTDFYLKPGPTPANWWESNIVKIETFNNPNFTGAPELGYAPRIASFKSEEWTPRAAQQKSMRFTAQYMPKKTGAYLVLAGAGGSDSYKVILDGKTVLEQPEREGQAPQYVEVQLTVGKLVNVQIDYLPDAAYPRLGFGIRAADEIVSPEVGKLAA